MCRSGDVPALGLSENASRGRALPPSSAGARPFSHGVGVLLWAPALGVFICRLCRIRGGNPAAPFPSQQSAGRPIKGRAHPFLLSLSSGPGSSPSPPVLLGVFPRRGYHLQGVCPKRAEGGHLGAVGPEQDEQLRVLPQAVAGRQVPLRPVTRRQVFGTSHAAPFSVGCPALRGALSHKRGAISSSGVTPPRGSGLAFSPVWVMRPASRSRRVCMAGPSSLLLGPVPCRQALLRSLPVWTRAELTSALGGSPKFVGNL